MSTFRSTVLAAVIVLLAPLGLAACAGTQQDQPRDAAPTQQGEPGAFPATVTHKFGSTVVEKAPTRVVALGFTDQDFLLGLDVVPITVRDWEGMVPGGGTTGPWVQDKLGGATPEVYKGAQVNPETIAAMRPDLIVAVYSGIDQPTYDALSKIAPVIAQTADFPDYNQPWDVSTTQIGQAVGRPAAAATQIDDLKKRFAALAGKHPQWRGRTVTVATTDGTELGVFGTGDARTRFFTNLGFTPGPAVQAVPADKFYASLSMEQADRVESQLLVWDQLSYAPGGREVVAKNPILARIPAVTEQRSLYLEGVTEKAFGWQSVPAMNYVLDRIEEPLVQATQG